MAGSLTHVTLRHTAPKVALTPLPWLTLAAVPKGRAQEAAHCGPGPALPQQPAQAEGACASPTLYLDRCTVVSSGDAGVPVPAHVHRGVGPVLALSFQGAVGAAGIFFRLLLQRDLVGGFWGRSPHSAQRWTGPPQRAGHWERAAAPSRPGQQQADSKPAWLLGDELTPSCPGAAQTAPCERVQAVMQETSLWGPQGPRPELTAGSSTGGAAWQSQGGVTAALCCFDGTVQVVHPLFLLQPSAAEGGPRLRAGLQGPHSLSEGDGVGVPVLGVHTTGVLLGAPSAPFSSTSAPLGGLGFSTGQFVPETGFLKSQVRAWLVAGSLLSCQGFLVGADLPCSESWMPGQEERFAGATRLLQGRD